MAAYRRKFSPSLFRHVRDTPAGVTYLGKVPFKTATGVVIEPGEKISRRQYENLRYQAGGWTSKAEYERVSHGHLRKKDGDRHVHEADAYRAWAKIYGDEHGEPMRAAMGPDSEFSRAFVAAYRDDFRDTSAGGPFARLLVETGLRDDADSWDVGDTDPK